jgi:hypothetical protein
MIDQKGRKWKSLTTEEKEEYSDRIIENPGQEFDVMTNIIEGRMKALNAVEYMLGKVELTNEDKKKIKDWAWAIDIPYVIYKNAYPNITKLIDSDEKIKFVKKEK